MFATAAAGCSMRHRYSLRPGGGRRVEHDLGAVEAERTPALGEVAVVADVHADLADGGVEDRGTRPCRG
jgi:hypothetical protein